MQCSHFCHLFLTMSLCILKNKYIYGCGPLLICLSQSKVSSIWWVYFATPCFLRVQSVGTKLLYNFFLFIEIKLWNSTSLLFRKSCYKSHLFSALRETGITLVNVLLWDFPIQKYQQLKLLMVIVPNY